MGDRSHSLKILKGRDFADRLREVCAPPLPARPLADPKYQRILIPGLCGGEVQFALLGFIGQALRIRGAKVTALMCDELLPACTLRKVDHHESACTRWCHKNSGPFARAMKLPHRWYGEFLTATERHAAATLAGQVPIGEIRSFSYRHIELGELIQRSLESFYKVGSIDLDSPGVRAKAREFLLAAVYLTDIGYRVLDELAIDKVLLEDGTKTDWGVIRAVARRMGIPVDRLLISPRGRRVMIEWDRPPNPRESMPAWSIWKDTPLTPQQEAELDDYLARRERVPVEGTTFCAGTRRFEPAEARRLLGLPVTLPAGAKVMAMFPNVGYDAGFGAHRPAFDNAADWVLQTVEFFRHSPAHHLVVKVHPGEAFYAARDSATDLLSRPPAANIHVVPPDSPLTAHSVIDLADVALVYTSTIAAEAAALGTPVILVGGGLHTGRGFTMDVTTPTEYFDTLQRCLTSHGEPSFPRETARRYAHAFFIRAALPMRWFDVSNLNVSEITLDTINDLAPGRDPAMDGICRSVLLDELPGLSPVCSPVPTVRPLREQPERRQKLVPAQPRDSEHDHGPQDIRYDPVGVPPQ